MVAEVLVRRRAEDGAGIDAAVAGAGAVAAAGVAAVADCDGAWPYSSVPVPDAGFNGPTPTVGAWKIIGLRGWCHMTSHEYTTIPISTSTTLKQSLS